VIARRYAGALAAAAVVVGIGSITAAAALTVAARPDATHVPAADRVPPAVTTTTLAAGGAEPDATEPRRTSVPSATPAEEAAPPPASSPTAPTPTTVVLPPPLRPPAVVAAGGQTAAVVPVGVLPDGELQLPDDPTLVGWWASSGMVGAPNGSIVLAGHVDSHRYGLGTFAVLRTMRPGDVVQLFAEDGVEHRYVVSSVEQTPKAALPVDVLTSTGPPQLVLITCGGEFDDATRHYADNLIVVATAA